MKESAKKQCMISLSYFVTICAANKVENFICEHGQHRGRPSKSWNPI